MPTGNQVYRYAQPNPFVTPTLEVRDPGFGAVQIYQYDQLQYSGPIIENIMFHISLEYEFRGLGRVQWKAYKTSETDFDLFFAGGARDPNQFHRGFLGAKTLQNYPVKWFPLYIKQIQDKIETLVNNANYPDDIGSLMARIFLNNTTHAGALWNNQNRLPEEIIVPVSTENNTQIVDTETVTIFDNIKTTWAFEALSNHAQAVVPRMGIDWRGKAYVNRGPLAIKTSDEPGKSNFTGNANLKWPRSVVGKIRTEQDITIEDGFITESPGSSVKGVDSIHVPSVTADNIDAGRPEQFRQIASEDAQSPLAIGKHDPDSGYSWFAHHPQLLQQYRYQPPIIERWENSTTVKDYVENLFSNFTPNLPWYFSQEVEKIHFSDWGGWLIQGRGGLTGPGLFIEAYADPQYTNIVTNCPFNVFFPSSSSTCTCGAINTAYAIWGSSTETLVWNQLNVSNDLQIAGAQKFFGPKTRLIFNASITLGAGTGSLGGAGWFLGVRTARIASVNFQPFVPIMGQTTGSTFFGDIFSSSTNINLMDAMAFHYPTYEKSGRDAILAIGIFVESKTNEKREVDAVDGPNGTFIPDTDLGCAMGASSITATNLYLYEPAWEGATDPRTPPGLSHGTIEEPPDYNLPILS